MRTARCKVRLRPSRSPAEADREREGRDTVASATPKRPMGTNRIRNAYASHDTAPVPKVEASQELMTTLICVAERPIAAGAISVPMRLTPGCERDGGQAGRNPSRHRG